MSNPLSFNNLTQDENLNQWPLEIYDKNYKMAGTINISTQFIWREADPIPKKLNSKCYLELTILDGEWFSDADTFGQQDPLHSVAIRQDSHEDKREGRRRQEG